jgi:hypothetical protein
MRIVRLALFFALVFTAAAQTGTLSIKNGVIDFSGAGHTPVIKVVANVPALPSTGCLAGEVAMVLSASVGQQLYQNSTTGSCTWTQTTVTAAAQTHVVVCNIGNAVGTDVITTGDKGCYGDGGSYTGTITRADIIGNGAALAACSITIDIWVASGAYPTASDKISASAPLTLSAAKTNFNMTRTGWSNTVPSNPIFGASVATVSGCVFAQIRIEY